MRMKFIFSFLIMPFVFTSFTFTQNKFNFYNTISDTSRTMDFSFLRDTVYTLKPYFIEINLATQEGFLHSRNGSVKNFGISSGTKKLKDGMDTNEGLFVIQAKLKKWYSRQFDSTLMLNWMGFNYGIGFHSLTTNGYYYYLGKKKSSHGCVRISRKISGELYKIIDLGTPVLVHSGNNIINVGFADTTLAYKKYSYIEVRHLLERMYKQLYSGRYFITNRPKIIIDKYNVTHRGLPNGISKNILPRQIIKSTYMFVNSVIPGCKGLMMLNIPGHHISFNLRIR